MKWFRYLSFVSCFLLVLYSTCKAGPYTNSIHGSSSSGVYRTNMTGYSRGNCAHCHEMHATPNPFALFANNFNTAKTLGPYDQSDDFCFYCHGTPSEQVGGINNYDYSSSFGGAPASNATDILSTFNQLSYHDLYDIWVFAKNNFSSFFTPESNPCVACHNPHLVERSCGKPTPNFNSTQTAISRPTDHSALWGDNSTEKMNYYAGGYLYQPPYYYNSTNLEPDGASSVASVQAGKTIDYVTFCTDCHNPNNQIYSTELANLRGNGSVIKIDWSVEKHGKGAADGTIDMLPPYSNASIGQYVLSCLDCHEPHGSPNLFLIRREVNGKMLGKTITSILDIGWLCRNCHKDDAAANAGTGNVNSWEYIHHLSPDAPYPGPPGGCGRCHGTFSSDGCLHCHYHGSTYTDYYGNIRRTF
ncbi:MAG: cytochrome c3 family protein [Thermodesulfobacteria bacterium]|nr:cytochrome c3 family protein [Thermodesulfobacteriota bacterium]